MSFVTIPGLVTAESTDTAAQTAEVQIPSAEVPEGATVHDVELMKAHCGDKVQVKAAGGIRDADTFLDMVRAGATRIGCSAGMPIIDELRRRFEEQGIESIEL